MQPLTGTTSTGIQRVHYTHDAMIDLILANPAMSQGELAIKMGYTQGWVSRIIGSDSFQARLAERKTEIVNPLIIASFEERLMGLALQSAEIIADKLDASKNPELAIKTLELSAKALGYGARPQGNQTNVQNNFVVALPGKIANEQDWAAQGKSVMAEMHAGGANQVIDVVATTRTN